MEIRKIVFLFILFFTTQQAYSFVKGPTCDKVNLNVLSSYDHYTYSDDGSRLLSKEIEKTALDFQWSEATRSLREIFISSKSSMPKLTQAKVIYVRKSDDRIISQKAFKLVKTSENEFKLDKFKFNENVQKPKYRPGVQYFIFYAGDKVVCHRLIEHYHATEETPDKDNPGN